MKVCYWTSHNLDFVLKERDARGAFGFVRPLSGTPKFYAVVYSYNDRAPSSNYFNALSEAKNFVEKTVSSHDGVRVLTEKESNLL